MNRCDYLYALIVLILFYLVISLQFCNKNPITLKSRTKDSLEVTIHKIPVINYSFIDSTVYRYIKRDSITGYNYFIKDSTITRLDTNKIIFEWLAKRNVIIDTLQNDTNALIVISDILYQNKIENRTANIKLYHHTTNVFESKNYLYGGLFTNFNDIYLSSSYQSDKWLFTGGYSPQSNSFLIGINHRVQLKK